MPESDMLIRPSFGAGVARTAWESASPRFREVLRGRVTVIINDHTRPAVSRALIEPVCDLLGVRSRVLIATGTHRDASAAEKDFLLGGLMQDAGWACNALGGGDRVTIGETSRGTVVQLHPWLVDADALLVTGSVEPHYFAGFTGGRKALLPGCSSYASTEANHALALLPGSIPAALEGNPVHEDMAEAARMLEKSIPVVMAGAVVRGTEGLFCCAGALVETFGRCVASAREHLCVPVGKPAGCLVLRPGGGLGVSLYQSMKAVYNCEAAVREGGVILLDSPCPEGLGSPTMEEVLIESMKPGAECPDRPYRLGLHAVSRLARIRRKSVLALRSSLDPVMVQRFGMVPVDDPASLTASFGDDVLELDDAGTLAPLLATQESGLVTPAGEPAQ